MADLQRDDGRPGRCMANLKVSRVGGVLSALQLMEALRERGWPIIIGVHVGETWCAAQLKVALVAQRLRGPEQAFGRPDERQSTARS